MDLSRFWIGRFVLFFFFFFIDSEWMELSRLPIEVAAREPTPPGRKNWILRPAKRSSLHQPLLRLPRGSEADRRPLCSRSDRHPWRLMRSSRLIGRGLKVSCGWSACFPVVYSLRRFERPSTSCRGFPPPDCCWARSGRLWLGCRPATAGIASGTWCTGRTWKRHRLQDASKVSWLHIQIHGSSPPTPDFPHQTGSFE